MSKPSTHELGFRESVELMFNRAASFMEISDKLIEKMSSRNFRGDLDHSPFVQILNLGVVSGFIRIDARKRGIHVSNLIASQIAKYGLER